jgi:hypothetical protein
MKGLAPAFDGSVLDTLRQWRFRIVLLNGVPKNAGVLVEITFESPDRVSSKILEPPRAIARRAQQ